MLEHQKINNSIEKLKAFMDVCYLREQLSSFIDNGEYVYLLIIQINRLVLLQTTKKDK